MRYSQGPSGVSAVQALIAGLLLLALCAGAAFGQDSEKSNQEERKRKSYTVREYAFKKLAAAQELIGAEQYAAALEPLGEMNEKKLNPYEKALKYQTFGMVYANLERYDQATESLKQCLAQDALPEGMQLNVQYGLAQMYMATQQFKQAIEVMEAWLAAVENPNPQAHFTIASLYAQTDDFKKAAPHAQAAVDGMSEPREGWLQLLLAVRFQLRDFPAVAAVLEQLVTHFPKKTYWVQLSSVYTELHKDKQALAALELAYAQDLLTTESELVNLAQHYLFNDVPYKAASVLEKGIADRVISKTSRHWELLARSWMQAREYEKALGPLELAAKLSDDGDLYVQLAQINIQREDHRHAQEALRAAIAKGGLKHPGDAHLLLGISYSSAKEFAAARKAFAMAQKHEDVRQSADQWLKHVEREEQMLQ